MIRGLTLYSCVKHRPWRAPAAGVRCSRRHQSGLPRSRRHKWTFIWSRLYVPARSPDRKPGWGRWFGSILLPSRCWFTQDALSGGIPDHSGSLLRSPRCSVSGHWCAGNRYVIGMQRRASSRLPGTKDWMLLRSRCRCRVAACRRWSRPRNTNIVRLLARLQRSALGGIQPVL